MLGKHWTIVFFLCRIQRSIEFQDSLSLVADGSDNQEYGLPYFSLIDKDTSCGQKFKVVDIYFLLLCFDTLLFQQLFYLLPDSIICGQNSRPFHMCIQFLCFANWWQQRHDRGYPQVFWVQFVTGWCVDALFLVLFLVLMCFFIVVLWLLYLAFLV